jgi:beta-galactosidase
LPTDPGYDPLQERRPQVLFSDWSPRVVTAHDENVEVYSNCDQVELFLNGKSLGAKPRPSDDAPRNWNDGRVATTYELRTAGKPSGITLSADRNTLAPDWDDVVYITATVVDEHGVLVPSAGDLITFKISGPGVVAAVDSGNNNSHEKFQAMERKAYQGRCFALLKAKAAAGRITLEASASGLKSKTITVNAVKDR